MRDDEKFEMMRAMDLLPQVAGASFATTWFRLGGQRRPTREEYRAKTAEYFANACRSLENFPDTDEFGPIKEYIHGRLKREIDWIMAGRNREVEKRYDRYIDYG